MNAHPPEGTTSAPHDLLLVACENGDVALAKRLVDSGASANARNAHNESALHLSVKSGNARMADYLLNEAQAAVDPRDSFGRTPLHWATQQGNIEMVEVLLLAGADLNAKDDKDISVTIYAEMSGHRDIIRIFHLVSNARR